MYKKSNGMNDGFPSTWHQDAGQRKDKKYPLFMVVFSSSVKHEEGRPHINKYALILNECRFV